MDIATEYDNLQGGYSDNKSNILNGELIGPNELVYNNDPTKGIHSGGFSVNSLMMKNKISPIATLIGGNENKKGDNVSDLFSNLVVPNWALSYGTIGRSGGNSRRSKADNANANRRDSEENDGENDVVDDDLYNRLLDLVKEDKPNPPNPPKQSLAVEQNQHKNVRSKKATKRNKYKENTRKKTKRNMNSLRSEQKH